MIVITSQTCKSKLASLTVVYDLGSKPGRSRGTDVISFRRIEQFVNNGVFRAGRKTTFQQRRNDIQHGQADHQRHRRMSERAGCNLRPFGSLRELAVKQQDRREQENGRGKADQRPRIIMVTEQRRAVAGVSGRDMQQDLACRKGRADGRRQQRQGIVAGARPPADIQNGADSQQRELDALEQAQRTGQFVQQELCGEGRREDQRYRAEAKRVEDHGERAGHPSALERQLERIGRVVQIGCDGAGERGSEQGEREGSRASPGNEHDD